MSAAARAKILVVEDSPSILGTVCYALEQAGYACLTAADGEEALHVAREGRPDLVLLDIMMPKLNGYQVCRVLRLDPRFVATPIVMVTARTQERDYAQGKEAGANDYVTKPFELEDLLQIVERHLSLASPG